MDESVLAQLYQLAFLRGDQERMRQLVGQGAGKAGIEDSMLAIQSDTEAFRGRLNLARELSRQAVDFALRADAKETAATWLADAALREAEFGNADQATRDAESSLKLAKTKQVQIAAAIALAAAYALALQTMLLVLGGATVGGAMIGGALAATDNLAAVPICSHAGGSGSGGLPPNQLPPDQLPPDHGRDCLAACLTGCCCGVAAIPTAPNLPLAAPYPVGAASGVLNTTRQVGGAIGSAAAGAVLQHQLSASLHDQAVRYAAQLPPQVPPAIGMMLVFKARKPSRFTSSAWRARSS